MNQLIIAFFTIVRKEILRFMRIWSQTLIPPIITTALYFAIFGHILGSKLGLTQGVTYMQFIAPGLIMMAVINNAYVNTVSSVYMMRFSKSIEEILVAPIPNYLILLGFCSVGVTRGIIVGLLVTVVALFFTHLHIYNILITFAIVILSAVLFSLAGFLNALFAKKFDDIAFIPTFILTPLSYLGGIFYPVSLLPGIWHKLSLFNPIVYMVNAFRFGIVGITDIPVSIAFIILLGFSLVLLILNLYFLHKGTGLKT